MMQSTPSVVVAALEDLLSIKAVVRLEFVGDVPHAVVTGSMGRETWVDLRASLQAHEEGDVEFVARGILAQEGWSELNLNQLLYELGVGWGFCDVSYQRERLSNGAPWGVEGFVAAVINAEGLDPVYSRFRKPIRDLVARHFGSGPD